MKPPPAVCHVPPPHHTPPYATKRQHTSAYVSIRQMKARPAGWHVWHVARAMTRMSPHRIRTRIRVIVWHVARAQHQHRSVVPLYPHGQHAAGRGRRQARARVSESSYCAPPTAKPRAQPPRATSARSRRYREGRALLLLSCQYLYFCTSKQVLLYQ